MQRDDAVRQLEYAAAAKLDADSWGHLEAGMYSDVLEYVTENGTNADCHDVIEHICTEARDGYRPACEEVRQFADTLCTEGGRPLTDGGDA